MKRFLVMFMVGQEQELAGRLNQLAIVVRERYKAFLLVEAPEAAVQALRDRFVVQEVAALYQLGEYGDEIDTSIPRIDERGVTNRQHPGYEAREPDRLPAGPHHWLVQFIGPVKKKWLTEIRRADGQPREPRDAFTHVVRADRQAIRKIAANKHVAWVGHLRYADRIAGQVRDAGIHEVQFFTGRQAAQAAKEMGALRFEVVARPSPRILLVRSVGRGTPKIDKLVRVHGVRQIRQRARAELANDVALGLMKTATAMSPGQAVGGQGLGLSGEGEYVAVCDGGLDTGDKCDMHPDLAGRVDEIIGYPPGFDGRDARDGHGTHVAGSVLGDGRTSPAGHEPIRGPAYRARLLFQATQGDAANQPGTSFVALGFPTDDGFGQLLEDAYQRGARVHVDAVSLRREGNRGEYDQTSHALDEVVWRHKDLCVVVAAGNLKNPEDLLGDAERVTPPGTAKNCITIGASESLRPLLNLTYRDNPVFAADTGESRRRRGLSLAQDPNQISPLSRRGLTRDWRNKPDLVAPGTCILSTRSRALPPLGDGGEWPLFQDDPLHYAYLGGTSQATALAAGAVTLLREYFRTRSQVASPTAALLKAALIAGALRLPTDVDHVEVVDRYQGYGRVNLDAVLAPANGATMRFEEVDPGLVERGDPYHLVIDVQPGAAPLRVVLAYSDYPGDRPMNCLNLLVAPPDQGPPLMGNGPAGRSGDTDMRNNVEVVHVPRPQPGRWRVQVDAIRIPHPPQAFALVYLANL